MEELITIYTFNYPHEAYVMKGRLESEGIQVFLKDENTVQAYNFLSNALGGVKLQVRNSDVHEAIQIMKESGFEFENDVKEEVRIHKLDTFTSKIPLLGNLNFFWRFFIMLVMAVIFIFLIYYFLTRKSLNETLTTYRWRINYEQGAMANQTIDGMTQIMLIRLNHPILKFNSNGMLEIITARAPLTPGDTSDTDSDYVAKWKLEENKLIISECKKRFSKLNGTYSVKIDDKKLTLDSDSVSFNATQLFRYN